MTDSEDYATGKWAESLVPFLEQQTPFSPAGFDQVEDAQEQFDILADKRVLVVGAGALGCEALKCLVMSGYADITIVDMDTIELSNLNRQFMFRSKDVGRYKAEVAAEFIKKQRPHITTAFRLEKIQAYGPLWMRGFDLVVLCLDNDEARQWINETLIDMVEFRPYTASKDDMVRDIQSILNPLSFPPGMLPPGFVPPPPKPSDWYAKTTPKLLDFTTYDAFLQRDDVLRKFQFSPSFQALLLSQLSTLFPSQNPTQKYQLPASAQHPVIISTPFQKKVDTVVPYCEGGTEGWRGHFRMLRPHSTFCLGCTKATKAPKENLHTHLCTIANVPRIPEHCIMYAHQLLWPKLIALTSRTQYQMINRTPNSLLELPKTGSNALASPPITPIDNTVTIDVSSDPHGVEFDADNMDHVYWCLDRAVERANQFNITPPTYAQTLGVIKGTIPAISSTNSLIASLCVNAAFQYDSTTFNPFFPEDIQDKAQKYDGVHFSFTSDNYNSSVGLLTNLIEKNPDCTVCAPRLRINCSAEIPLIFVLLVLMRERWFGLTFEKCYESIAVELIDIYEAHPALQTKALFRSGNAFDTSFVSPLITALATPIGQVLKEAKVYRVDDLTKTHKAIKFDLQFFKQ